jgi:hypothetical protein
MVKIKSDILALNYIMVLRLLLGHSFEGGKCILHTGKYIFSQTIKTALMGWEKEKEFRNKRPKHNCS